MNMELRKISDKIIINTLEKRKKWMCLTFLIYSLEVIQDVVSVDTMDTSNSATHSSNNMDNLKVMQTHGNNFFLYYSCCS